MHSVVNNAKGVRVKDTSKGIRKSRNQLLSLTAVLLNTNIKCPAKKNRRGDRV